MSQKKNCFLKSIVDDNIAIHLQDKVEVCLGRCPETNIRDKRCSRNQVSITADYNSEVIKVKHLGGNPSSANGIILRNDSHILKQNELLEFLVGEHKFRVEFESPTGKPEKRKNETSTLENDVSDSKRFCKEESISMLTTPCGKSMWEKIEDGKLYVFTSVGVRASNKIAAYDMDGTLILTKSGRVFPKDNDDWKLAFGSVKSKLSKFACEGYKIVILTNQAGIGRGKTNINEFKTKIENIVRDLNVPVQVFIATSNSIYRKPAPGMWTFLETKKNDSIKIDMSRSFYVGDAAGRIANWCPGKKKDFSFADRLLALNLNLQFFTPEEHFCNERPGKFTLPMFNPAALDEDGILADGDIVKKSQEVVILVGCPGSGKTHITLRHLVPAGYVHVNRDSLGSWQKCVFNMESAVAAGRRVVVDNTNPDRESRRRFVERAKVPCRCLVMTTSIENIRHNVRFREITDTRHIPVNEMIVNSYKNKLEPPSLDEGFTEIVNVNFVPSFSDPEMKKLYRMYLLEK